VTCRCVSGRARRNIAGPIAPLGCRLRAPQGMGRGHVAYAPAALSIPASKPKPAAAALHCAAAMFFRPLSCTKSMMGELSMMTRFGSVRLPHT
jgi:hypothetical protein